MHGSSGHLLRVLGIAFGLAAVVGGVIGQGILRAPGIVADATGSGWVIIALWLGGGIAAMVAAMPLAELAAAMPRAGGAYTYITRAFGNRVGIVGGITSLAVAVAALAMLCFVTGELLLRLGVGEGSVGPIGLGLGALALFCVINAFGTRVSGGSQVGLAAAKGALLVLLVVVLLANPGAATPVDAAPLARGGVLAFVTAMVVIGGTYQGWDSVVYFGEEVEQPGKVIPRALFGGIFGVTAIYLLVNFALLHTLGADGMAGDALPAASAAGQVFGPRGDLLLTIFGVVSVAAIANLLLLLLSRLGFALARAGLFPAFMARVDPRGTPLGAMLMMAVATALLLASGTYIALVTMSGALMQALLVAMVASVYVLRRREPQMARPWRVPFYPWPVHLALVLSLIFLGIYLVQDPLYSLAGFIIVGIVSGLILVAKGDRVMDVAPPETIE